MSSLSHLAKKTSLVVLTCASSLVFAKTSGRCDLEKDHCGSSELSVEESVQSLELSGTVKKRISELMQSEKASGRDFKVAIIARMGSDLTGFRPLIEKDGDGKFIPTKDIISKVVSDSAAWAQSSSNASTSNIPADMVNHQGLSDSIDNSRTVKYSHMGIAIKMTDTDDCGEAQNDPDTGNWAVFQLLYSCDDQHSAYIYRGTMWKFFNDNMFDYQSQIIVPNQEIQDRLFNLISTHQHDWIGSPHYNAAALPNEIDEENSNQFILELLAAAQRPEGEIANRQAAQEFLRQTEFVPTRLTAQGLKSAAVNPVGAKILAHFMPSVCFANQPYITKYDIGEVITALSVQEYMQRQNLVATDSDGQQQIYEVGLTKQDKSHANYVANIIEKLPRKPSEPKSNKCTK